MGVEIIRINKKFILCITMILMLLIIINTTSATQENTTNTIQDTNTHTDTTNLVTQENTNNKIISKKTTNTTQLKNEENTNPDKKTKMYFYNVDEAVEKEYVNIRGKLIYNQTGINGSKIILNANGKNSTITPGPSGYFTYNIKAIGGTNTVIATYNGTTEYTPATTNTTFTAKKKSIIYFHKIENTVENKITKISGKLLNNGKSIPNSTVSLDINGNIVTVKPNNEGYFTYNMKPNQGINTVIATYNGTTEYTPATTNTTFTAKKKSIIYFYSINTTQQNIPITGKLLSNGTPIKDAKITLNINGENTTITPGPSGYFSYEFIPKSKNNIIASYDGDETYGPSSTNTSFEVDKNQVKLYFYNINNNTPTNEVFISGKLLDNSTPISNAEITLNVNGENTTITPGPSGYFTYNCRAKDGLNNITAIFKETRYYESKNVTTTFVYNKKKTTLDLYDIDASEGPQVTITGKLSSEGNIINGSKVTLNINGENTTITPDPNGYFAYPFIGTIGENNITAYFDETDIYAPAETRKILIIDNKTVPDIRLVGSDINPGVKKVFIAFLPEDSTGYVNLTIDNLTIGENIVVEDYGNFMYSYKIPETFNSENYTLYFKYSGDENYFAKRLNVTLRLTPVGGRINGNLNISNYSVSYGTINDLVANLDPDAFGEVIFTINNVSSTINITNGQATLKYNATITPGKYTLIVQYKGNYKYNPSSNTSNITITKMNTKISIKNITSKAGAPTIFEAKVVDETGTPVKNTVVEFRLNTTYIGSSRTNETGNAVLNYTLPSSLYEKTYVINIKNNETSTTFSSTGNSTLKLEQLKTKVYVPNISTIPSKNIAITASIVDEFNNAVSKGVVTFIKDNKTIGVINVSNGYAKFQYPSNYETSTLTYIFAHYVGDWKYANSVGNGTYKVTKIGTVAMSSAVTAKPNDRINLTVRLLDDNQSPVTDGNVTFSLNDKIIGTVEVSRGNARIIYELDSYKTGNYKIYCAYHGSNIYKPSNSTNTLTVELYETKLQGESINAVVGTETTITVTVTDEEKYNVETGIVSVYVGDDYVGNAKVSNGFASISYIPPSKYDGMIMKYYVTYEKNSLYDSSSYSNTITISHQRIVYVNPNGNDNNLGDKAHPFKTIKHAIEHISLFGTIYLSEGTFTASGIQLNDSITLIGSGRDKTFIDGQNSGKAIFNISKRNVVLSIDGITIKNGKSNAQFSAGAIVSSSKLTITNSRFIDNTGTGNYSGGAIYTNGILNITNTEFKNNKVTNINSQGGAIRTYNNLTYITNCTFNSNKVTGTNSTGASVLYVDSGDIIINGSTFNNNSVTGAYVSGGVIRSVYGAVLIENCTFTNNHIKSTYYATGGIVGSLSSGISITNSIFNNNTIDAKNSGGGAVIYIETAYLEINNTKITSNKVYSKDCYGGAIYGYYAVITMTKCEIKYNQINSTNNAFGGVIYTNMGNITINKTTFTNNSAVSKTLALAGAVYIGSNAEIIGSNFINNSVNASNIGGGAIANTGNLTISNTNFINNNAVHAGDAITATNTAVNIIENNYWGSTNPKWSELLNGVNQPKTYSKTNYK